MNRPVREWLPDDALSIERFQAALAPVLDEWRSRWLGDHAGPVMLTDGRTGGGLLDSASAIEGEGFELQTGSAGRTRLLELIFSGLPEADALSERDRTLLDGPVERALQDLADSLAHALKPDPGMGGNRQFGLRIGGTELGSLTCRMQALIRLVRRSAAPKRNSPPPLADLRHALGGKRIAIEAVVGRLELALEEVRDLAPGDVVILDRKLDAPLDVRLAASRRVVASGERGHGDDPLTIVIDEAQPMTAARKGGR